MQQTKIFLWYSLAEKNRDLNQACEKLEQIEDAKQRLKNELENMKIKLNEKDNEIQKYNKKRKRI